MVTILKYFSREWWNLDWLSSIWNLQLLQIWWTFFAAILVCFFQGGFLNLLFQLLILKCILGQNLSSIHLVHRSYVLFGLLMHTLIKQKKLIYSLAICVTLRRLWCCMSRHRFEVFLLLRVYMQVYWVMSNEDWLQVTVKVLLAFN